MENNYSYIDSVIIDTLKGAITPIVNAQALLNISNDKYAYARGIGFGASDSSKLIGLSPFCSVESLLEEKRNLKPLDESVSLKANVRKGKDLEDFIINKKIIPHIQNTVYKPDWMYMITNTRLTVNFDGVSQLDELLIPIEVKVVTKYGLKYYKMDDSITEDVANEHWTFDYHNIPVSSKDSIPIYYYTQLQQQMLTLNAPWGILAVLDDENWTMHYFKIMRDEDIILQIKVAEIKNRWCLHPLDEILQKLFNED